MPRGSNDRGNSLSGGGGGGGGGGNNSSNNNRKKFGKNLNRMVKPAAPPIPNDKSDRNARNGLLLLSTKKQSTGLLASKTNATISSGTATANGDSSSRSLNLQSQSNPSTHDVLLSAVVGASQVEAPQKPDAWGVAENQQQQQAKETAPQPPQSAEEEQTTVHRHDADNHPHNRNNNTDHQQYEDDEDNPFMDPEFEQPRSRQGDSRDGAGQAFDATGTSWDEYGGRGRSSNGRNGTLVETTDKQGAYMSQLAKERAQIKRKEEEARVAEQKAKAAQRLRELERKKANNSNNGTTTTAQRTLWEPDDAKKNGNKHNRRANGKDSNKSSGKSQKTSTSSDTNPSSPDADEQHLIHLSSYEDRDRGEQRGAAAAPRMLFDPKSGSMVEVKAKPESNSSAGGGSGTKPRKDRRGAKASSNNNSGPNNGNKKESPSTPETPKNGRNKQKGRNSNNNKVEVVEKKKANPNRCFPRTCGVLYKRDGKGHLRSADGCDGDVGLASHSVPGGRIRNPDAFQAWSGNQPAAAGAPLKSTNHSGVVDNSYGHNPAGFSLKSGIDDAEEQEEPPQPVLEWVKADEKIELVTGVDDSPTLKPTAKEFAPSEAALAAAAAAASSTKDSADEASASLAEGDHEDTDEEKEEDVVSHEPEEEEEEEEGLGFDPLQGIDFMTSPTNTTKTPEEIATVDLPALALDPPMFTGTPGAVDDPSVTRPLFGFSTSGTWGSGQASSESANMAGWGSSSGSAVAADGSSIGIFRADVFGKNETASEPAQFLAAGTSGSWGPSVVPGLDRLPTINAPNHASGPAD